MADIGRFPVRFHDEAFAEDLAHASATGRRVAEQARARLDGRAWRRARKARACAAA